MALAIAALPGLALPAFAWVTWSRTAPESATMPSASTLPVDVVRVERTSGYALVRSYTGELRPRRQAELGFEVSGRVLQVLVDEGTKVEEGAQLARLDTRRLTTQHARLEAEKAQLQAVLSEMVAGPRSQTIDAAEAELAALGADRELAHLQTERRRGLLERDSLSAEELDRFAAQERVFEAREAGAAARLAELREGTRSEVIAAQEASLAGVDAALESLFIDITDSVLRAPFAGTISHRYLDEGAVVGVGAPLLRLVEDRHLEAWIGLPPVAAVDLEVEGLRLTVGDEEYTDLTLELLPEIDGGTRTRTAILAFDAPDGLFSGQVARLHLERFVERAGFWLPMSALTEGSRGLWSCFVLPGDDTDRLERADLEVLHIDGERALVRGTLREGDRVVISGAHRITVGQQVRPQDAALSGE